MFCVILLICGVVGVLGQPGGWQDYHGKLPDVVFVAVSKTLISKENIMVKNMKESNVKSQVVAGVNYKFDLKVTDIAGQITMCNFVVYVNLSGTAKVTSYKC